MYFVDRAMPEIAMHQTASLLHGRSGPRSPRAVRVDGTDVPNKVGILRPPQSEKCVYEKPYSIIVISGKVDLGYLTL
jgi:hypothetical protein